MSKVQSDYILKQGGEIGQLKDEIKRLQAEIAELKALNVHKIIARQQKDLEQSRSDYLDLKEECKAMDTAMQQTQRERDALWFQLSEIRDCAKGIMPLHSGKPDDALMEVIVGLKDARWTRLFAIYSGAEKALAALERKPDEPENVEDYQ